MNKHATLKAFCNACQKLFNARRCDVIRGNRGRFCSMSCARRWASQGTGRIKNPVKLLVDRHPKNRPFFVLITCALNWSRSVLISAVLQWHVGKNKLADRVVVDSGGAVDSGGREINWKLVEQIRQQGFNFIPDNPKKVSDEALRKANLILTSSQDVHAALIERLERLYPNRSTYLSKIHLFASLRPSVFGGDLDLHDPSFYPDHVRCLLKKVDKVISTKVIPPLKSLVKE